MCDASQKVLILHGCFFLYTHSLSLSHTLSLTYTHTQPAPHENSCLRIARTLGRGSVSVAGCTLLPPGERSGRCHGTSGERGERAAARGEA